MNTYELFLHALDKNELDKFLIGQGAYQLTDKWVEVPTDLSAIFLHAFNRYIEDHPAQKLFLEEKITSAILNLLNSPIGVWWTVSIIDSYLFGYIKGALLFNIDVSSISSSLNKSVKKNSKILINDKSFIGNRFDQGLYDDLRSKLKDIHNEIDLVEQLPNE
jgi:hypothetical protein